MKYILMLLLIFLVGCNEDCACPGIAPEPVDDVIIVIPEPEEPVIDCTKGGSVELTWNTPTLREDGTALKESEILRYDIEYQIKDGEWVKSEKAITPQKMPLPFGFYCFKIRTVDIDGLAGQFSEEICIDVKCEGNEKPVKEEGAE